MATVVERIRLEKRRNVLLSNLRGLGNLMRGSLCVAMVRCGSPRCACAQSEKHRKLHLTVNLKGRTRTAYVGEPRAAQVQALLDEYDRARAIIDELTAVNLELLRPTVAGKAKKS